MMNPHTNPYIAGNAIGNTPAFVGRKALLNELFSVLTHPDKNAVFLSGQRRIGKTSILQHLQTQLTAKGNYYPVYFDLHDNATWALEKRVVQLAKKIARALNQPAPDLGPNPKTAFQETWLPEVLQSQLGNRVLVLLFDELDVMAASPQVERLGADFFEYLNKLLPLEPQSLKFVFVTGRNINRLSQIVLSLVNGIPEWPVSLLSKADTTSLIRLSEDNQTLNWPDETVESVWQYTQGHPFLTQQICFSVWQRVCRHASDTIPSATADEVENVIPEVLTAIGNTLDHLWQQLYPAERVVASALAEIDTQPITEQALERRLTKSGLQIMVKELQDAPKSLLKEWDLLRITDDGSYHFHVELVRRWIKEQHALQQTKDDVEKIEPAAENYFKTADSLHKQGGDLNEVTELLQKAIALNPNHTGAFQLLGEVLIAQQQFESARQLLERLYQYEPAAARPLLTRALLELARDTESEKTQLTYFGRLLELEPEQPEALAGKTKIWTRRVNDALAQEEFEAALHAYRQIEFVPEHKEVEIDLPGLITHVLTKLKREERYQDTLELTQALSNEFPGILDWASELKQLEQQAQVAANYRRALDAFQNGERETARKCLMQVLNAVPDYKEATQYLHYAVTGKQHPLKTKRWFTVTDFKVLTLVAALGVGVFLFTYSSHIEQETRNELMSQELKTTKAQNQQLLISQSLFLAELSQQMTKEGHLKIGVLLALEALPMSVSESKRPVVKKAVEALRDALTQLNQTKLLNQRNPNDLWTWVYCVDFSPDGQRVVTASDDGYAARLYDTHTGKEIAVLKEHEGPVSRSVFNTDGTRVATASRDRTARLWDGNTGAQLAVLKGHTNTVSHVAFSPNNQYLITASKDKTARLWDTESYKQVAVLMAHKKRINHASFSADGQFVITASDDKTARLWDVNTGQALAVLTGHQKAVSSATFSPDGQRIVTASKDGTARLWDVNTGKQLAVLEHNGKVSHATFSPDGQRVVTASWDKTAVLWETKTGKQQAVLTGHEGYVVYAAFSSDGQRVVTTSSDSTARIWDVDTGKQAAVLTKHEQEVMHAAFSPDGQRIATASKDGTSRLSSLSFALNSENEDYEHLPEQALIDEAHETVPDKLTQAQREQYFLEHPSPE